MSYGEVQERPVKKRRFFVDDGPHIDPTLSEEVSLPDEVDALPENEQSEKTSAPKATSKVESHSVSLESFDPDLLKAVIGADVAEDAIRTLQQVCGRDVQRAINMYFDGTWNEIHGSTSTNRQSRLESFRKPSAPDKTSTPSHSFPSLPARTASTPDKRYVGAFGVAGWATRSGSGLIIHGEKVHIERAKPSHHGQFGRGGRMRQVNKRLDVVVRFTNSKGEEVGRLENDVAAWISTLIDQKICTFEANCIYIPDKIRTNDTIYLQLRCYLRKVAFEAGAFMKPADNNRQTGLFEAKETQDERNLRLRQVAMVKLFDEISMHPVRMNATTEKHKRQGILRAAEEAEQHEQATTAKQSKSQELNGNASPPSDEGEDGEELEQDQLDSLYKKAQSFDFNTPEAEPPESFAMSLRKYQRQALYWMMAKEKDSSRETTEQSMHPLWEEYKWPTRDVDDKELPSVSGQESFYVNPYSGEMSLEFPVQEQNCLGGILADEMGLGKTIEMLSLMHSHRNQPIPCQNMTERSVNDLPRLQSSSTSVENAPCTTLVVAPMSLLAQWQSEAEKASNDGTLKVMVYYGSEKSANLQMLCCEANAATAPSLIITSYGVVLSEYNAVATNGGNRGSHGGLFSLNYFRVILDEAHYIKNRQSKTAKACYEISAVHRWVLTGTPIVNRLEDLFSLVRFLRVEPWSNFSFWKTFITVPFESKDFIRALDVVQTVLEPLVLRRTKDMKTPEGEALVPLPPKSIGIESIELGQAERDVYEHIFTRAKRTFNANVEAGTLLKSYTTIFAQILRLRQSCCHPVLTRNKNIIADEEDAAAAADLASGLADDMDLQALIASFEAESEEGEHEVNKFGAHVLKQIKEEAEQECPICAEEPMNDQTVTGCWHSACKTCLLDYIKHQREKGEVPRCFNCREPLNTKDIFEVVRHAHIDDRSDNIYTADHSAGEPRISLRRIGTNGSAKISALLTHLNRLRQQHPGMKSVVFSQFTSFLDLIEPALARDRIPFLRFDGSMSQKQRASVLSSFASSTKGFVLLLSLRAGGVGLNLTCAKQVFMMDPWWSFAVEAQAIDRVHRMGQDSEVVVTRFIVEGSIEQKMLKIQDRKKFIASSLGMMNDEEKRLQRIEDIRELLS